MILLTETSFSVPHIDYEGIRSKKRRRIQSLTAENVYNQNTVIAAPAAVSQQQPAAANLIAITQPDSMNIDDSDSSSVASTVVAATELVIPDFNCTAVANNEICRVQLSNLLQAYKAVVLFFYESDFTPSAVNDIALIDRHFERLQRLHTMPLAMSTDTEMVHAAFLRQSALSVTPSFPLVADTTRSISRHFNIINSNTGLAQRSAFIIDRSRKVRFSFVLEDSRLSHSMDTICNILQSF